jgi:hypothetical protein
MDKSKQVSQSTGVPFLHVRLYAHLGSRDKNLGPRAARMSQTTTTHVADVITRIFKLLNNLSYLLAVLILLIITN